MAQKMKDSTNNNNVDYCSYEKQQVDTRLLCVYDKKVYDLQHFYKHHPGGKLVVELSKNTDITHLYNSYHWGLSLTSQAKNKRLNIREVKGTELNDLLRSAKTATKANDSTTAGNNKLDTSFYTTTDESILKLQKYLMKLGYSSKNMKVPWYGALYYLIGLIMYFYCGYQWYVHENINMQYGYGISFGLLGFFVCGFIQHEGSHNALSNYQWINRIGAWLICPWGHPDVWMYKHVIEHHPNTNTRMDEDIQFEGPILRHHYMSKLSFFHRFQAWSITILSMFVSISHPMNFDLWAKYYKTTIIYLTCFASVFSFHFYLNNCNLLLTYIPVATFGIVFVFITQLSHIQEACIDQDKVLERPPNFTKHQIKSCFDYDHNNLFVSAFSIFLNYQTYHHLLPGISHFHFTNKQFIQDVNRFLQREGIKEVEINTFLNVVKGYFTYMVKLQSDDMNTNTIRNFNSTAKMGHFDRNIIGMNFKETKKKKK